jgi:hypothetical protein
MPIWQTASVEEQPKLVMDSWRVIEVVWSIVDLATVLKKDEKGAARFLQELDVDFSNPERPTSRHLVGYVHQNREGRVSSSIVEFDLARLVCRTSTGRTYGLIGEPGWNGDARYVLGRWMDQFKISEWRDVTDEVMEEIAAPRGPAKTLH